MKPFQVLVGNVGHVYDGANYMQAQSAYSRYIKASKANTGRAAGEPVTLFHNGEIRSEYFPPAAKFTYSIDLDERGSFRASVSNSVGETVYTILAGNELGEDETSIFEDGFMRHKDDICGLQTYLRDLGVIPQDGTIEAQS